MFYYFLLYDISGRNKQIIVENEFISCFQGRFAETFPTENTDRKLKWVFILFKEINVIYVTYFLFSAFFLVDLFFTNYVRKRCVNSEMLSSSYGNEWMDKGG